MPNSLNLYISDEQQMIELGAVLADSSGLEGVIYLQGDLGAGKTTLSRGLVRSLGYTGAVKSPTYTLVEPYELERGAIYHFDLYRLADPEELEFLGVRDYLSGGALCLIEWPQRGEGWLPAADLEVRIEVSSPGRQLQLLANSPRGEQMLEAVQAHWGGQV
ncbi:tRNA (adenosine(37)-N6)-threonylcarbamoyltransferase complex ATPase subunit type 1 TsaE [Aestuariirhabdus litorea]|uniref:tRNA threonylcarbamoyladenosine biosynthesis protein TsaE n=1 Tax=Aestuariirhabdus litorea TaxID=2528527 RepID=A0A3P3VKA8_9GAMM|nr:tRNA (adenosine(37)-N6)-threonylcarbamoyltransferase complex ATPase subunit type 1 TsaE [Aestuariirhabdus litorea]RRJ82318.1 tRNA (adenosine(37)-N6)-threonylcarbamoyltransferase complex ATPase subunit type 1 TsaE [Aestuariirhabdus litorea]RWW92483.1 tRNA (adenosine(37)-N6)-threonylcarbamoyltransferase complex ATPase subunit type 1 TsaE [Endozoicomonadaceae bacterium GTF-13]